MRLKCASQWYGANGELDWTETVLRNQFRLKLFLLGFI
jgi:hypothetical protein